MTSKYPCDLLEGPDKLVPADSYYTSDISKGVKLRLGDDDDKLNSKSFEPMSVYTMFKRTVDLKPNANALAYKLTTKSKQWTMVSFKQYWLTCHKVAKSFIKLGLNTNECVSIIGFNSPQWFYSIIGTIFAGGVGCGIYATNSPEACQYVINDCKSKIVVVENKQQLDKIIQIKDHVNIKRIIQYSGKIENNHGGLVIEWDEFMEYGSDVSDSDLTLRIKSLAPNKCASLIYTSGTTGNPKAAMISHDSITFASRYLPIEFAKMSPFNERMVSYLPLSHIAAQIVDIFSSLSMGTTIYFAQPDALKGTLNETLKEVRPTFFWGVPRVWEKMQENIQKAIDKVPKRSIRYYLFNWSRKVVAERIKKNFYLSDDQRQKKSKFSYLISLITGSSSFSISYFLARYVFLKKIFNELGLNMCRNFFSGAAPISIDTLEFFISLGMPLCEVYGMSETTGPHSIGTSIANRIGSIGCTSALLNQSKIIQSENSTDEAFWDGSGELAIFGRHVFMGYLNDELKTKNSFESNARWFITGDMARLDSDNYLFITGRLKELLITAGGENIPPVPIEDSLKAQLPKLISNAMLIGDKRKYLTILITLKTVIDLDTMTPTDTLTKECVEFLESIGSSSKQLNDVLNNKDEIVNKAIENGIKKVNEKATSNAYKIQKFQILPRDFSLANGELGPTLKLRRQIVMKIYASEIDQLYETE